MTLLFRLSSFKTNDVKVKTVSSKNLNVKITFLEKKLKHNVCFDLTCLSLFQLPLSLPPPHMDVSPYPK